ncbi:hypothetical protein A2326_00050 [candidate division WWE3 bacterium RIFOXYB2_FULL_41_6]|nr:MAG: hypothetical protein A2326_00050 [candidate division WWE3 bacterium RIFOXYB2_FULL_41_6]OGZ28242.1 MAG: hypothetical protein A2562_00195 [Candidatus Nealsonbacteria bacterium RIFOXYD1_FULL_39_11]
MLKTRKEILEDMLNDVMMKIVQLELEIELRQSRVIALIKPEEEKVRTDHERKIAAAKYALTQVVKTLDMVKQKIKAETKNDSTVSKGNK